MTYSDTDIGSMQCNQTNKDFKWYENGYRLIIKKYIIEFIIIKYQKV